MKKEEIHLGDWQRILLGEAPAEFMLEVLIRSIIIFLIFAVIARMLGKRMNGQLTQTELAVMLMLGGLIAPAMQQPDRGILISVLALVCILFLQRSLTKWGFKSHRVEEITQGVESALVKDGVLQLDEMKSGRVSHQQIYAVLRAENVYNLKKVDRLYFEGCGLFSIYTNEDSEPGLSVLPPRNGEVAKADWRGIVKPARGLLACQNCGNTILQRQTGSACPVCQATEWTQAVC